MTKKTKKPATIRTNRWESELPILDRLLPIDEPTGSGGRILQGTDPADLDMPTATDEAETAEARNLAPADRLDIADASQRSEVTINNASLAYEPPTAQRRWRRRLMMVLLPTIAIGLSVGSLLVTTAAGAQDSGGASAVKSIRFDLEDAESGSIAARYRSMVVVTEGVERRLAPMSGSVRVTMNELDAAGISSVVDGLVSGVDTAGFTDSVAGAATSTSVDGFVRLGRNAGGESVSFSLFFDRPLVSGDHLLVQEGNGDAAVDISAVDIAGAPVGVAVTVAAPYQVNSGHDANGSSAWASVVEVERFLLGSAPIAGIRVTAADAEVKAMALIPEPDPLLVTLADTSDGSESVLTPAGSSAGGQAAVGLAASVQPAIAVDGAGCVTGGSAPVSVGQAVTFCFEVTNLGATNLTDIRITDQQLGLADAALPLAAGAPTLSPGEEAVFYHHAVAGSDSVRVDALVTAKPVDEQGVPIVDVTPPSGASANASAEPLAASVAPAVELVEMPTNAAVDSTPVPPEAAPSPVTTSGGQAETEPNPETETKTESKPPAQLAMTGMPTEPWVLVILAMGLIFIGYTAFAAFGQTAAPRSGRSGHDQLDALGFD